MPSKYFGENSFSVSVDCFNCGCDIKCTESNIIYHRVRNRSGESICKPGIFCNACHKYNNIYEIVPVIVKSRILKREQSYSKTCKECNTMVYIDKSLPYVRKWYHFCEYRVSKCDKCNYSMYFRVHLIPSVTLDILKHQDEYNIYSTSSTKWYEIF